MNSFRIIRPYGGLKDKKYRGKEIKSNSNHEVLRFSRIHTFQEICTQKSKFLHIILMAVGRKVNAKLN